MNDHEVDIVPIEWELPHIIAEEKTVFVGEQKPNHCHTFKWPCPCVACTKERRIRRAEVLRHGEILRTV